MVAEGTLNDLRRGAALPVEIQVTPRTGDEAAVAAALPGVGHVNGAIHLTCAQEEKLAMLGRIAALGNKVSDLEVLPPSLEDIYSHFSRRDGQ